MKRVLTYLTAPLLLAVLALSLQLVFGSGHARAGQETTPLTPEEKCEKDCSDLFEKCARLNGAEACRPAYDLCRQDSPKGPKSSTRRARP